MQQKENWIIATIENGTILSYGSSNHNTSSLGSLMKQLGIPLMEISLEENMTPKEKIQIPIQPL